MTRLTVRGTGISVGLFFEVTFVLCVLWGLLAPRSFRMAAFLEAVFPGFVWLTPASFFLGLVEALLYGAYVAVVFVPLFNYFEAGRAAAPAEDTGHRRAA